MKFRLEIDCDNAAFEEDFSDEIARILRGLTERIYIRPPHAGSSGGLFDSNGNRVGTWEYGA